MLSSYTIFYFIYFSLTNTYFQGLFVILRPFKDELNLKKKSVENSFLKICNIFALITVL